MQKPCIIQIWKYIILWLIFHNRNLNLGVLAKLFLSDIIHISTIMFLLFPPRLSAASNIIKVIRTAAAKRLPSTPQAALLAKSIGAYNLGLCKMLSLQTGKALFAPPLLAIASPNLPSHRKRLFCQRFPPVQRKKCALALV